MNEGKFWGTFFFNSKSEANRRGDQQQSNYKTIVKKTRIDADSIIYKILLYAQFSSLHYQIDAISAEFIRNKLTFD